MSNLKKVASLLVLVFGLMLTANAQSDNAAFVVNKPDGATATLTEAGNAWVGFFTVVVTKSGNINLQFHGDLVFGDVTENLKFSFTQPFLGQVIGFDCVATKSGKASCNGKEL